MSTTFSPLIVPVFLPHAGCPHQCLFCNQQSVTGTTAATPDSEAVHQAIKIYGHTRNRNNRPIQIAFYGGNFLGLPAKTIQALLATATRYIHDGSADTIRFSTRPDTVDEKKLALIGEYPVTTVEIGAQSMSDRILNRSRRGHQAGDTVHAVRRLKESGVQTGIQMMVGLPGDDDRTALASGHAMAALAPAFVRIYPTVVLAGSPLEPWYRQGRYEPLGLDRAVALAKQLLALFHAYRIPVIRLGLQASADLDDGSAVVAGPYHPAFGHLVYEALFFNAVIARFDDKPPDSVVEIVVHPRNISKMRGLNNHNWQRLNDRFHPLPVNLHADSRIGLDRMIVNRHPCSVYGDKIACDMSGASL